MIDRLNLPIPAITGLLFIALSLSWAGCSEDDDDTDEPKASPQTQLSREWRNISRESEPPVDANNDGKASSDVRAQQNPCTYDDMLDLSADGTAVLDFGDNLCDPNGPEAINGEWILTNNEERLQVNFPEADVLLNYRIISLSREEVTFQEEKSAEQEGDGKARVYTYTFVANE